MTATTDRTTDVHGLCLGKVVEEIQAMGLEALERGDVANCQPHYKGTVRYGISVVSARWVYAGGPTTRDDIGYGCAIVMAVRNDNSAGDETLLNTWEHAIRRRFLHTPVKSIDFPGATALRWSIEPFNYQFPRDVRDADMFSHRSMLVRYWVREPRDIGK